MVKLQLVCLAGLLAVCFSPNAIGQAFTAKRVSAPVTVLRQRADLVVLGTVGQIAPAQSGPGTVVLNVGRVIMGQPPSLTVNVQLTNPPQIANLTFSAANVGKSGIWFLKASNGGYTPLPLVDGVFVDSEFYLPVSSTTAAMAVSGTADQQLLTYLVQWYLSVSNPGPYEDDRLFASLVAANQADALAADGVLLGSVPAPHHVAGLAAAIRFGSLTELTTLAGELPTVSGNAKFFQVIQALRSFDHPGLISAIQPLQQLIGAGASVAGLQAASGIALRRIGTNQIAPAMAELLDSTDPEAQLIASSFFGSYSLFADSACNFPK